MKRKVLLIGICVVVAMSMRTAIVQPITIAKAEPIQINTSIEVTTPAPIVLAQTEVEVSRGTDFIREKVNPELDLTHPSGIDFQNLKLCVPDSFVGLVDTFELAEKNTGVNALFLMSVSALESGWGKSELAQNNNNLFGWVDPDRPGRFMYFDSKEDCILYVAQSIKNNYLNPEGKYFEGYTVHSINEHYCTNNEWTRKVLWIMEDLEVKYESIS